MRDEYDFSTGVRGKYSGRYESQHHNTTEDRSKVLLLHLSDIHISTANDPVLSRVSFIGDALKNVESAPAAVVCVLAGDIAHAGTDQQYTLALQFVTSLTEKLERAVQPGTPIYFVAVAGNHDCDFT